MDSNSQLEATANLERARRYLQAVESQASGAELAGFFAADVVVDQFPNRLVPKLVRSGLADIQREAEMGRRHVARQTYRIVNAVAAGDTVALEVTWEGVLALPVAGLEAGATMRAYFGMFLKFRDGKIVRQANYDCFEPW